MTHSRNAPPRSAPPDSAPTVVSRRAWLAASIGSAVTLAAAARAAEPASVTETSGSSWFDIHVHITQAWFEDQRGPLTAHHLLRWMDAHDVRQAAVLPLVSPEAFWYPVTSEFVLRETAPHRDRLIPFCAIDPRTLATHLPRQRDVVDMLRRYRDAGARGFGEHKARLAIDDPLNLRLYEACSEVEFPVLFHLDNQANIDQPGLPGLDAVLARFPQLVMIGHGKGWWASIAGGLQQADLHVGYPRGPVAPGGAIDRLMDKYPNLYGDLSSSGAHALLRDREFGAGFLRRRYARLLFGTDYYDLTQPDFAQFDLFQQFPLPNHMVEAMARENARRLLVGGS